MATHVLPPAPPVERPRVLLVATSFAAAATFMLFVAALGVYLLARTEVIAAGSAWLPQGVAIPLQQPNTIFMTLLLSVVTIQWAVNAIAHNDRQNAFLALGLTLAMGAASIVMTTYLWTLMKLDVAGGVQGVLIYTITAGHTIMLIVAMVYVALMALRALGGQFDSRQHDGVTAAAIYWHTMVFVYALIWIIIYVTK
ncbi:MAG: hypothetical protein FGM58_02365 [Acidimicrobiia bacterium]|nr:hypothetical protein [Acidimicrobiia bacterium]